MSTLVEFIGLCVFTAQSLSPTANAHTQFARRFIAEPYVIRRVVAVMPRVPDIWVDPRRDYRNTAVNASNVTSARRYDTGSYALGSLTDVPVTTATAAPVTSTPITLAGVVEPHTAMLLFRQEDCFDPTACTDAAMKSLGTGWRYVELRNGEQVAFVTDAPNVSLTVVPELGLHLSKAPLGRYSAMPYEGTAAVFTMPVGVLSACRRGNGRVDTKLTLETREKLKITFGSKSLTVRAGTTVIAANVPLGYANQPHGYQATGASHMTVYCAMEGDPGCKLRRLEVDSMCEVDDGYNKRPGDVPHDIPDLVKMADWSCSNSQWP
ncbi:MAG TPA: hypothetical protein VN605_06005 [Thermoanaerobaculia bacterium]|nr:hypothetical protein [Thermoanaerobaculia bacterium]